MVTAVIDKFLMLGADAPAVLGLFPLGNRSDQLIASFDDGIFKVRSCFCAHTGRLEMSPRDCQQIYVVMSYSIERVSRGIS